MTCWEGSAKCFVTKCFSRYPVLLYCKKIWRHENFAVSRSSSKNREIKMSRKMPFQLNREIKMHQKIDDDDDDEIFEPERNFSDVFLNFPYELSFPLYNGLIYCLRTLGVETFANRNFREWENSRNFCISRT